MPVATISPTAWQAARVPSSFSSGVSRVTEASSGTRSSRPKSARNDPGLKSGALAFTSTGGSTSVTRAKPAFSARIRMLSVLTSSGSVCGRNGATAIE